MDRQRAGTPEGSPPKGTGMHATPSASNLPNCTTGPHSKAHTERKCTPQTKDLPAHTPASRQNNQSGPAQQSMPKTRGFLLQIYAQAAALMPRGSPTHTPASTPQFQTPRALTARAHTRMDRLREDMPGGSPPQRQRDARISQQEHKGSVSTQRTPAPSPAQKKWWSTHKNG